MVVVAEVAADCMDGFGLTSNLVGLTASGGLGRIAGAFSETELLTSTGVAKRGGGLGLSTVGVLCVFRRGRF